MPISCFRGNGNCSFVSLAVHAGDDGENADIVDSTDRAALVPDLTNAGTMHVKHQHLINDLSFIYSFNHPAEVENEDGVLRATSR